MAWALAGQAGALVGPQLVGDFESPDAMVVVYTDAWPKEWSRLVRALAPQVPVYVLREEDTSSRQMTRAIAGLPDSVLDRVETLSFTVDTAWSRDWGPLTARTATGVVWLDTPYAIDRPADDIAPQLLGESFGADVVGVNPPVDGGAIASNGHGLCVMTQDYLDKHTQGERIDPGDVGCRTIVYVPALEQEETKHADLFVQFVASDAIVLAEVDELEDPLNATRLAAAQDAIVGAGRREGLQIQVYRVPMGPPDSEGNYYPYVNFTRVGDVAIVPRYDTVDPRLQARALGRLRLAMPGVRQILVTADEIAEAGGSVHCVTVGLWL